MVRKKSLASDFIASATFGFSVVYASAGNDGNTQTRVVAAISLRRILVFIKSLLKLLLNAQGAAYPSDRHSTMYNA